VDDRSSQTPVAIIGMACMFPKARDLERYWSNILNRVDAITDVPPTHWRPEDYFDRDPKSPDRTYAARGGFLSPVDFPPLEFGITPNALEAIDTTQLLGLMAAREALEDAGYGAGREFDRDRVSVILGVTGTLELVIPLGARLGHPLWRRALREAGVAESVADDVVQRISDSYVEWQEDSFPGLLGNVAAGRIANRLNLGGTNCVVDAACASSLSALNLAMLELASGRRDMVLTGGLDTFNDIFMYMCFSKTPALSPTGDAKPFDAKADGTILGEGLGVLVLKRLADAERDGDKIYAVIKAIGSSSDGKGNAIYAPSPAGQAKALRQAYRLADVSPKSIELVEAHGTGTRAGDAAELSALTEVYRESGSDACGDPWCAIGSVKSQIGHTKAAAGAAGLIKAALALHQKVLPPTIKVNQPIDSGSPSPIYINTEKRPWLPKSDHPRRAAVSSFGFGGSNFHCILEEYRPQKANISWDGNVQILAFSAETQDKLAKALTAFRDSLSNSVLSTSDDWEQLRYSACCLRAEFSVDHAKRLLMVIEREKTDLDRLIADGRAMVGKDSVNGFASSPDGIFFGRGPAMGKLAFVFPGQGSQSVGMLRDLACQFPQMQEAVAEADASWLASAVDKSRLSDFIYPRPEFGEEARAGHEEALRNTAIAQPALGAVSRGALLILQHFGIRPEAVAGHSYGELVALHAAGQIDAKTLYSLSMLRGRLMSAAGNGSDPGGMLAVRASLDSILEVLASANLDLVIANKNTPLQFVLSGASAEVERAIDIFKRANVDSKKLPVSSAFHSRFVGQVRQPLLKALKESHWDTCRIPVFANTTGKEYPDDLNETQELLAGQLAQPVEFLAMIENMHQASFRTFVEVGPGNKLTGLIAAILRTREHHALALDASSGKQSGNLDLARLLASLAAQGHAVELSKWDPNCKKPQKKPALTIPICGANYVRSKPRPKSEVQNPQSERAPTAPVSDLHARPGNDVSLRQGNPNSVARNNVEAAGQVGKSLAPQNQQGDAIEKISPILLGSSLSAEVTVSDSRLADAFKATQENLLALQRLAEQTTQVHRQFLEGQDKSLQVFKALLAQQQALITSIRDVPSSSEGYKLEVGPSDRDPTAVVISAPALDKRSSEHEAPGQSTAKRISPFLEATRNGFQNVLLEVVAEKTGYPVEMLELDMELDSDLGIDSIKRVEIFSAIQERLPQAPPVKSEHLGTLRTLRQVVDFLASVPERPGPVKAQPSIATENGESIGMSNGPRLITQHSSLITPQTVLLEVVAEKTGYPTEMLELDMELDADLGIDSIKRVEIFSALQERLPQAPVVKSEHLGTLRTLRQVVDFLSQPEVSEIASALKLKPSEACAPERTKAANGLAQVKNGFHSSMTAQSDADAAGSEGRLHRYVLAAQPLSPEVQGKALSLASDGDFWITDDCSGLSAALAQHLEKRGFRPRLLKIQDCLKNNLPARLTGLIVVAPAQEVSDEFIQDAFGLLRMAMPGLRQAGKVGGAVFATVSRIDGAFGLRNPRNAVSGGLAGIVKTAAKEWPEVSCKALDLSTDWSDHGTAAEAVVEKLLLDGPTEIGLSPSAAVTLELSEAPLDEVSQSGRVEEPIKPGEVILVTGGARGVTAETAVAMARAFRSTLVLLGRSPEPEPEPDWLAELTGETEIKSALLAHAHSAISPRKLAEQFRRISASREIRQNIQRIQAAGGRVLYQSLDVRDESAMKAALADIQLRHGAIRALVHGAGVLEDRLIEDKTPEQFERVFSTKVAGLRALLSSLDPQELRLVVLFSSVTARFGRTGQVDYAVANEVLNKIAQVEARRRPHCRVVSINWGPWGGGMVTPPLKRIFAQEGVGLIPLEAGADFLVREIRQTADRAVEIVAMADPVPNPKSPIRNPNIEGALTLAFERTLSVDQCPFLRSHVIDGRAVLPLAMSMEWLAHAALHGNPGLTFHGFENVRVLRGVILGEDSSCTIRVLAGKPVTEGGVTRVAVELRSTEEVGRKRSAEADSLHVRGEVILTTGLPQTDSPGPEFALDPYGRSQQEIYDQVLFHGPDLQGIETVAGWSKKGIVGLVACAPAPTAWIDRPLRNSWLADPLVIDCAFQLMVLWTFENMGRASLPCFVGHYRQYVRSMPRGSVRVVVEVKHATEHRATADILFLNSENKIVARMKNYESVIDIGLNKAFRRNQLGQPAGAGSS
jgi:acyl transferase domain-containing protein/NAD(P)-dependent dehydrogenase (short-subunit alcohol dehydrogenase family)